MNKMNTVIFDMDGVLFDTERLCTSCWKESADAMDLGDMSSIILECVGLNRNDTRSILYGHFGKEFPYEEYMESISARMREKIEKFGLPLKDGVMEILHFLSENKYQIGLASSSRLQTVTGHLDRSGLGKYFSVVIGGDMVLHSKPMPDIYLMACDRFHVSPQMAYAIEDSPNGIRSAYGAGMKTIMVPDLIQPTPEIEAMLYGKYNNLMEVKEKLALNY